MLMNVDSIEIKFGNGNVLEFRAGIDLENLKSECPIGGVGIVFAECSDIEALKRRAVFEFERENWYFVIVHFQGFHATVLLPSTLILAISVNNFDGCDSRTIPFKFVFKKFALSCSFHTLDPSRSMVEIVCVFCFVGQFTYRF